MTYARVGVYALQGSSSEVTRIATEEMLPVFQRQPGFVDYRIVFGNGKIVSISTWQTEAQADEGTRQAAEVVGAHPSLMTLEQNVVGDVTLSIAQ